MEFEYGQYVTFEGQRWMVTNWEEDQTRIELFRGLQPRNQQNRRVIWVNSCAVTEHSNFLDPNR